MRVALWTYACTAAVGALERSEGARVKLGIGGRCGGGSVDRLVLWPLASCAAQRQCHRLDTVDALLP